MGKEIISNSMIGEGAVFEGKFFVSGSFRIDGHFEGELQVTEHLYISPVGKLKTETVYTKTMAVGGIFIGNIEASDEVHLLSSGRVLGNIRAPKLVMEPGVVVQGSIDITGTDDKSNAISILYKPEEKSPISVEEEHNSFQKEMEVEINSKEKKELKNKKTKKTTFLSDEQE